MTTHRPLVIAVSQATRAGGSAASIPSSTEADTWSPTLSGWPSVTDSEVRRNEADSLKDVDTTVEDHIGLGPIGRARLVSHTVSVRCRGHRNSRSCVFYCGRSSARVCIVLPEAAAGRGYLYTVAMLPAVFGCLPEQL